MEAVVNGKTIELSEAGWLLNLDEWSEELAVQIAVTENVGEMNEEHWNIINMARTYFQENGAVCEPRAFSKLMKKRVRQRQERPEVYLLSVPNRSN